MLRRAPIRRTRGGTYRIDLPETERVVLRALLPQLRQVLEGDPDDPRARRLFPDAYGIDPEADAEYQRLMRDDLVASRVAAIEQVLATVDATDVDEATLNAWMTSVNSVRLVLGTLLGVTEELDLRAVGVDDPDAESYALYEYLSYLLSIIVDALEP